MKESNEPIFKKEKKANNMQNIKGKRRISKIWKSIERYLKSEKEAMKQCLKLRKEVITNI